MDGLPYVDLMIILRIDSDDDNDDDERGTECRYPGERVLPQSPLYSTMDETGQCSVTAHKSKEIAVVDSVRTVSLVPSAPLTRASTASSLLAVAYRHKKGGEEWNDGWLAVAVFLLQRLCCDSIGIR